MVKVDISSNMGLAQTYNVQFLPTLMVFKGGEVVDTQVGLTPPEKLQQMIDAAA